MKRLSEIAAYIKSANAGAGLITFDIGFANARLLDIVGSSPALRAESLSTVFQVDPALIHIYRYEPTSTLKITLPRAVPLGGIHETDFDGVQQFIPLLDLPVDDDMDVAR